MRRADLNALMDRLRSSYGEDSARRLQRASDEIPGLDQRYSEDALHGVFLQNRDSAIASMPPGDFEKFSVPLPPRGREPYQDWDTGRDLNMEQYLDYLNSIEGRGGLLDTPFLNVNHLDHYAELPHIAAHEGRHRMRAMNQAGHKTGLVMVRPSRDLQQHLKHGPTYETAWRSPEEKRQAFLDHMAAYDNTVTPEYRPGGTPPRDPRKLPDLYAEGGRVGYADGGATGRELNDLGLYSKALEETKAAKQGKGKVGDYLRYLKSRGVKDTEIRALKLDKDDPNHVITKDELAQRIRDRRIKLKADVRSKKAVKEWEDRKAALGDSRSWRDRQLDPLGPMPTPPSEQYEPYTRKGGDNYTEQLLSLPRKSEMRTGLFKKGHSTPDTIYETPEHAESARAALAGPGMPQDFRDRYEIKDFEHHEDPLYQASHFGVYPNLLAHIRTKDRTTPEGDKVLYGEEYQSDWAQGGREHGFRDPRVKENEQELRDAYAAWRPVAQKIQRLRTDIGNDVPRVAPVRYNDHEGWTAYQDSIKEAQDNHPGLQALLAEEAPLKARVDAAERVKREIGKTRIGSVEPGPYVTDTADWVDLALKKHLLDAHKGGYDAVGWSPGEENADHYGQRLRNIKSLHWIDPEIDEDGDQVDENGFLEAYGDDGVMYEGYHKPEDLHQVIGKERAAELLSSDLKPRRPGSTQYVRKLDFPEGMGFGGEGMSKFYNEIVKSRMRKLVRGLDPQADVQWHPVSEEHGPVEEHPAWKEAWDAHMAEANRLYESGDTEAYLRHRNRWDSEIKPTLPDVRLSRPLNYRPAHLVRMTPAMKDKLAGGLEEFRRGGFVGRGGYSRGGTADYINELSSANRGIGPDEEGLLAYPRDRYIDPHYGAGISKGWTLNPNLREDGFLRYPGVNEDIGEPYFNAPTGRFRSYSSGGVAREHFDAGGYSTGSYGGSFADNSRPSSGGGVWGSGLTSGQLSDATMDMSNFWGIGRDVGFGTVGGVSYGVGPSYNASGQAIGGGGRTPTPYAQTIPGARAAGNPADAAGAGGGAQPGSVHEALGFGASKAQQAPQETQQETFAKQSAPVADPTGFGGLAGGTAALAAFGSLPGQKPGEDRTAPADSGFMNKQEQADYGALQDLARNTFMEAGNQSPEGMLAAAYSPINRAAVGFGNFGMDGSYSSFMGDNRNAPGDDFDASISSQIYSPRQYSWTNAFDGNTKLARSSVDSDMRDAPDTAQASWDAATKAFYGMAPDPSEGAMSYFNPKIANPSWKGPAGKYGVASIDDHDFYGANSPVRSPSYTPTQVAGPGIAQAMATMTNPWGFSSQTPVNDMADEASIWSNPVSRVGLPSISRPVSLTPASAYTGTASQAYDGERNAAPGVPFGGADTVAPGAVRTWMNPRSEPDVDPGFERSFNFGMGVQQGVPLADITPRRPTMDPAARAYQAPSERDNAYGVADSISGYDPLGSIRAPSVPDPLTFRSVPTERITPPSDPAYTRAGYHDEAYDAPSYQRMGWHDSVYDAPSQPATPLGSPRTPTPASAYAADDTPAPRALPSAAYGTRANPLSASDMARYGLGDATPQQVRDYRASITGRGDTVGYEPGVPGYKVPGTRAAPLSDAEMAAAGLGDQKSWLNRNFGFRSNSEVDADTAPYQDANGNWVDPSFSSTMGGKIAAWGLGLGLTALSPAAGLAYGITALAGKNPMINGMDRLANRMGYEANTPTTDPSKQGGWFGSGGSDTYGGGTSYSPGFDGYGSGRSLSTFNGNSGGNGYVPGPYALAPVANPSKTKSKEEAAKPEPVLPDYWDDLAPWQRALWS